MKEELLHYVWQAKQFDLSNLETTQGESIHIHQFGMPNRDAGPDFSHARITIGEAEWCGHVEMHLKSSDWYRHRHQDDTAYNNVILHVVFQHNTDIKNKNGVVLPTLELKGRIPLRIAQMYEQWQANTQWIPCANLIGQLSPFTIHYELERLAVERLSGKAKRILKLVKQNKNDWETTTFQLFARYLGGKVNADAFQDLARRCPFLLLKKMGENAFAIEALLFGQAGLLEFEFKEDYPKRLQQEYLFLKKKFKLENMSPTTWKFSKMRPAGFPTIRIAQLAKWVAYQHHLLDPLLNLDVEGALADLFDYPVSSYWQCHYTFEGKIHKEKPKRIGEQSLKSLWINVVTPLLFAYGKYYDLPNHCEKSLDLLTRVRPENNTIIRGWKRLGVQAEQAMHSQALLHLKNEYCDEKRCLECGLGHRLLKGGL